ncbi:MAG TPA: hypothetical protein VMC62_00690 [Longilinea sp.]|nr:hypothetical protein [Longilinea sp.]
MDLFRKLGFTKADEMDSHIALCAVRSSWLVVMLALFALSTYDVATQQTVTMPFIIFLLGMSAFFSTDLYLRRNMTSDRQE